MSRSIIKTLSKQLVMVVTIMLILFAAYLSIGRQFLPAVSRYKPQIEQQITEALGVPVTIDTLTGYVEGFNPAIGIEGLRLQVFQTDSSDPDRSSSLKFEKATININMAQSIWQRQIVLDNFVIEGLEIIARQRLDGNWQISGMNVDVPIILNPETVYQTIQRVSRLEFTNLNLAFQSLAGNVTRFRNTTAVVQNGPARHFIHINTSMEGGEDEILVSVEVTGNSLDQLVGQIHASLPHDDYSGSSANELLGTITLGEMIGGGEAWISLAQGQVQSILLQPQIESLNFAVNENSELNFEKISGVAKLTRDISQGGWELTAENLQFNFDDWFWQGSDTHVQLDSNAVLRARAEAVNLDIVSDILRRTDLAGAGLSEQLELFQPQGALRNLSLVVPLQSDSGLKLEFSANTDNVALASVRGSPTLSGINGYVDLTYDFERRLAAGFAEIESENFSIHLPNLFEDSWSYDYVNGRLDFEIDTLNRQAVKLSSGILSAESSIVDGVAQFSSNTVTVDGERITQDLSLLVGARRVDARLKSAYLPTGPNIKSGLRSTMEWLDQALIDATVTRSGVIYQGSSLPDALPDEKNFQAFFEFADGEMRYSEDWPQINGLNGKVLIDGNRTDIQVDKGSSDGLTLTTATGQVRNADGGGQILTFSGSAGGTTQAGIDFLANAPLNSNLGETIAGWQAQGDVTAQVRLRIPLNSPTEKIAIEVAADLQDNSLLLPQYQLQFDDIVGKLNFDSAIGLHDSEFQTRFFSNAATVSVSSQPDELQNYETIVLVDGLVEGQELAQWERQNTFVRDLLMRTEGTLQYSAQFSVFQDANQSTATSLKVNSDLQGLALNFPDPFRKEPSQAKPLSLTIDFGDSATRIQGVLGSELSMRLELDAIRGIDGIIYSGTIPGIADPWLSESSKRGLELRGNLDVLELNQWLDTFATTGSGSVASPSRELNEWISLVNLDIGTLNVFGQKLNSVNVEIQDVEDTDYWTIGLISDDVTGSVLIPFDRDEYIEAYLAFLRLPGAQSPDAEVVDAADTVVTEIPEIEQPRIDLLAGIDPRELPKFKFFTGNLSIGDKEYGLGQFTLDPSTEGAEFSDLIVSFRGLKAGTLETEDVPRFSWHYDGTEHRSRLRGLILADNLAEVLTANGFAASLESSRARFEADLNWPGSPAFFSASNLSGKLLLRIEEGRFLQGSGGQGALKLISIINFSAIMRRARFSDDLLRSGLAYDEIVGDLSLNNGVVSINNRLVIEGPSSIYQIGGKVDLAAKTIDADMLVTLPVSSNIPWIGLLTANIPLAIGAYLFDRIFGDQVDNLTSAQYTLKGPWEGLEPRFSQAFGSPDDDNSAQVQ